MEVCPAYHLVPADPIPRCETADNFTLLPSPHDIIIDL